MKKEKIEIGNYKFILEPCPINGQCTDYNRCMKINNKSKMRRIFCEIGRFELIAGLSGGYKDEVVHKID